MKKNRSNYQDTQRLVVEAPYLKKGQVFSSGGVREGGRIVEQYKNPVPYKENNTQVNNYIIKRDYSEEFKNEMRSAAVSFAANVGTEIAINAFNEIVIPALKDAYVFCREYIFDNYSNKKVSDKRINLKAQEIIEEKIEDKDDENIIYFPKKKVV